MPINPKIVQGLNSLPINIPCYAMFLKEKSKSRPITVEEEKTIVTFFF